MTAYVAQLHSGTQLVRLLPLDHVLPTIDTPAILPWSPVYDLDPEPSPAITIDRWQWTGERAEGSMTAELWERTFGSALPSELDRRTWTVPVVWLRYQRA